MYTFEPTELSTIQADISQHLSHLPSAIDSFLEDHIIKAKHYRILVNGEYAGWTAVYNARTLIQFALFPQFRQHGQAIFARAKKLEEIQAAFVPTCDQLFLAHALDDYRQLHKQAYIFTAPEQIPPPTTEFHLRPANTSDIELITTESGDFFSGIPSLIEQQQLFVTLQNDEPVAFGIMEHGRLVTEVASIGMFVIERFRQRGIGTATIRLLIQACYNQHLRPIAGCWYYNHSSKKTLEKAGLYTQTRLLKIEF